MTKRAIIRNLFISIFLILISIPAYAFYRSNLECEWLFNAILMSGILLLVFGVFAPSAFTYCDKQAPGLLNDHLASNPLFRKIFIIDDRSES